MVVWGVFLAPASSRRLQAPWLLIAEALIFGLAAVALYSSGQRCLAAAFAAVYLLNRVLLSVWGQ